MWWCEGDTQCVIMFLVSVLIYMLPKQLLLCVAGEEAFAEMQANARKASSMLSRAQVKALELAKKTPLPFPR